MNIVTEVSVKKQGTGAKGPWTMYAIVTDDGRKASGFDLVKVGDQVTLKQQGKFLNYTLGGATGEKTHNPVQAASVAPSQNFNGVEEARRHIMQSANLYVLCVNAVTKYCAAHFPEVAQTSEMFQAATGTLFIEASRAGMVDKMPTKPVPND